MKFSDVMNNYMNILNCSAKDLSESTGLSPTLISRYLNDKRTPRIDSEYFKKITIYFSELAKENNINLTQEEILNTLQNSITQTNINYDVFIDNFNIILMELNINVSDLAKHIGYDASFISKIKNKSRKPSDLNIFVEQVTDYIIKIKQKENNKQIICSLIDCSLSDLNNNDLFRKKFIKWISSSSKNNNELIENFLYKLDTFNLNDYIKTDLDKIKIPTTPVILKNSKTLYGKEGRKKAEAEFLKTTLMSKSKEPIFFYNDFPMAEAATDVEFKQKWILAVTLVLKKGLHLNMVHNIDRPLNEMLLGLENWIPIYMTGSISPYYFKTLPSDLFCTSHCTSGSVALSGECLQNNDNVARFNITTKKEDLEYYKKKSEYLLSKAKPLMTIYKEKDKGTFNDFLNGQTIKKIKVNSFTNIDFYSIKNKYIIINKKTYPEIHFVIHNSKLRTAIETFINKK